MGTQKLYKVKKTEMNLRLHKFQTAIIRREKGNIVRGSGNLISPNLVLTCAHNFWSNMQIVDANYFEIYVGQCGNLEKPYRVEKIFVPQGFIENPPAQRAKCDYALIKLKEKVFMNDFIPLSWNYREKIHTCKLAIFGYP